MCENCLLTFVAPYLAPVVDHMITMDGLYEALPQDEIEAQRLAFAVTHSAYYLPVDVKRALLMHSYAGNIVFERRDS